MRYSRTAPSDRMPMRWFKASRYMAPRTSPHPAADTSAVVLGALRWNMAMRTTVQIVNWLITIVVVRLLTAGDFGFTSLCDECLHYNVWEPLDARPVVSRSPVI